MVVQDLRGSQYQAATTSFDIHNPMQALASLLQLTCELLETSRAALYEISEEQATFVPRFAQGVALGELGNISTNADHPVLKEALRTQRAASTDGESGALGLPLGPGTVACAPCISGGNTIGLIFYRER